MVSGRVPKYVKSYAEEKNITISDLIMKGFDFFRSTDRKHALERLNYHKDRVIHWEGVVLQNEQECNTKNFIVLQIKKLFLEQNRGSHETKRLDMNWLETRAKDMLAQGFPVTVEELYDICTKEEKK